MTAPKTVRLRGAGGKKPKNPTYTNDNLFSEDSIELLLGIGEGPIYGLQNEGQSLFVGDVPLQRMEGSTLTDNFTNLRTNPAPMTGANRSPNLHAGYPNGAALPVVFQKQGESASVDVGTQVLYETPVIRYTPANMRGRIKRLEVRVNIAQLGIETSEGTFNNTAAFRVEYKPSLDPTWQVLTSDLEFPDLPAYKELGVRLSSRDSINEYYLEGKTGSGFIMDFKIDVSSTVLENDDWMIRITKNNPDYLDSGSTTKEIAEIIFDSFQMIGEASRTFVNTAVIHITGTASDQFSSLPDFYGIYKGLITPVPLGYLSEPLNLNPYRDCPPWTGQLENAYHSNPAWVLYDLLNNERYGYRKYVPDLVLNKNDFYEAGVWCDQQVLGQNGEYERRYTMNITIAENQNAWDYLQNIAGAFDGILYDDGEGTVRLKVDKWVKPKVIFTPETINAEGFAYSFTDVATQYNELTVSFTNPARGWEESRLPVTYVGENDGTVNGVIPLDFVAVGCTTESEAIRRAKARGLTASTENTLINFTTTRLGLALDPLEIFYVADPYMDWGQTGRAEVISGRNIYLRDELPFTVADLSTPYQMRIQTLSDLLLCDVLLTSPTSLLVTGPSSVELTAFDNAHFAEFPVFVLSGGRLKYGEPKPFRATTLEPTNNYNLFSISGLEVNPKKFDIIGDSQHLTLTIDTRILNGLNLRQYVNLKTLKPTAQYLTVTITLDGTKEDLYIIAKDVDSYAFTVGDWSDGILPPAVLPKVIVKGNVKILGRGGKGGDGGDLMGLTPLQGNNGYFPAEYGQPVGSTSVMGGKAGQNGGPSANFDHLVDLEVESGAILEVSGGYGGGYGADSCYITCPLYLLGYYFDPLSSYEVVIFRTIGSGGSGGKPLGAAGQAKAFDRNVPAGSVGTESSGGVCPEKNAHPVAQLGVSVWNGVGHNGLPSAGLNNPVPSFVSPVISYLADYIQFVTYAGSRVNGSQGVAITNGGNLNLTNNGTYIVTP